MSARRAFSNSLILGEIKMDLTAIRARAARWAEHDAKVPFHDDRRSARNGTNPAGRRPHSFLAPTRKPVFALIADNDNVAEVAEDAA